MRIAVLFGLVLAAALFVPPLRAEDGQGTADPSAAVEDLRMGTYWYGAEIDQKALIGKVVLVEIWGS